MRKAEAKVRAGNLHLFRSYFQPKPCAIALIPLVFLAPKVGSDVYGYSEGKFNKAVLCKSWKCLIINTFYLDVVLHENKNHP